MQILVALLVSIFAKLHTTFHVDVVGNIPIGYTDLSRAHAIVVVFTVQYSTHFCTGTVAEYIIGIPQQAY